MTLYVRDSYRNQSCKELPLIGINVLSLREQTMLQTKSVSHWLRDPCTLVLMPLNEIGVIKAVQFRQLPINPLRCRLICSPFFKGLCCSSMYFSSLYFPSKQKHHFSLTLQYLQLSRKPVSMMLANELRTFFQDWQYTHQVNFTNSGEKGKAQFFSYYKKENECQQITSW